MAKEKRIPIYPELIINMVGDEIHALTYVKRDKKLLPIRVSVPMLKEYITITDVENLVKNIKDNLL